MKVGEIIDRDLSSLSADCPVSEAIEVLYHHNASGLPVLDDENRVIRFYKREGHNQGSPTWLRSYATGLVLLARLRSVQRQVEGYI